jgi:exopolyphosphatase/guanosine-5'-triphosphate,3'-diphosphate pyrophosphatase
VFEGFALPTPELAVAVGGSSTSLRRLVGGVLDHETLERGLRILATTPSDEVARAFEMEPERVRLLPGGMLVLEEISDRLERPLLVGRGGLREGVILEMLIAAGWSA